MRDALPTGAVAGAATALTAALTARRERGAALTAVNAVSHFVHGERAARERRFTWRHTALGYLTNSAAAWFWAVLLERLFGERMTRGGARGALLGAGTITAIAYATDYHVVPKRFTPGYELAIGPRSLAKVYGALALSLALAPLLRRR